MHSFKKKSVFRTLSSFPLFLVVVLAEHVGCVSSGYRDRGLFCKIGPLLLVSRKEDRHQNIMSSCALKKVVEEPWTIERVVK